MIGGLERLFARNGNKYIARDIFQLINSAANPKEFMQLYKYLFDAVAHELKDPQGKRDYSHIFKVVERNNQLIKDGLLADTHPNVVLFVVGHLENPRMYFKYIDFFRESGIAHGYWVPLHHFQDTATNSEYFIEMAECLLGATGKKKIDVVAHSRGGLVTTYAAVTRPDELRKFGKIITVGTPHHGTFITNAIYHLMMGKTGERLMERIGYSIMPVKEMMYCSRLTEMLSSEIKKLKDVEFYSIFSLRHDEAIIPGECSIVDSSNFVNIDIDGYLHTGRIGHAGLTTNQNVIDLELQILKGRFNKEKFLKEHTIMTFDEYRREREGKRYQERKPAEDDGSNGLTITPDALNMILNGA